MSANTWGELTANLCRREITVSRCLFVVDGATAISHRALIRNLLFVEREGYISMSSCTHLQSGRKVTRVYLKRYKREGRSFALSVTLFFSACNLPVNRLAALSPGDRNRRTNRIIGVVSLRLPRFPGSTT